MYVFLWAATLVFGPGAAQRAAQRRHVDYFNQLGSDPDSCQVELNSISVPAPFVVTAEWSSNALTPQGQRSDILVPTLNQIATLDELRLYYCGPVDQVLQHLHTDSLRSMQVHTYSTLEIPTDVTDAFAQRMPKCTITSTVD